MRVYVKNGENPKKGHHFHGFCALFQYRPSLAKQLQLARVSLCLLRFERGLVPQDGQINTVFVAVKNFWWGGEKKFWNIFSNFQKNRQVVLWNFESWIFFRSILERGQNPLTLVLVDLCGSKNGFIATCWKKIFFSKKKNVRLVVDFRKKTKKFFFQFFQVNRSDRVLVRKNIKQECICHVIVFVFGALGVRGPPSPKYKHSYHLSNAPQQTAYFQPIDRRRRVGGVG